MLYCCEIFMSLPLLISVRYSVVMETLCGSKLESTQDPYDNNRAL